MHIRVFVMDSILVSYGSTDVDVPAVLLDEPNALKDVLSYETWSRRLTVEDRQYLQVIQQKQFLPRLPDKNNTADDDDNVRELFSGANFSFGNPVDKFIKQLCRGEFGSGVQHLQRLKRQDKFEQYQYSQRRYYHKLLNELIISTQDYLESAAKVGATDIPPRHCLEPLPEDEMVKRNVDLKYKKVLYQCRKEAEVLDTSSDDDLPTDVKHQIDMVTSVLDILNMPVIQRPSDITDSDYLKMLRHHAKRRRNQEDHPELNTSTVTMPDVPSQRKSPMKQKMASGQTVKPLTARPVLQHKPHGTHRTKPTKRTAARRQTASKTQISTAQQSEWQRSSAAISHTTVMSQLQESALSRPVIRTDYVVGPSSDEEKAEFRRQEWIRYQNPHKSFTYLMHGFESTVGPVKGAYDKDTVPSKARDHFLLLKDRPPVITILALVRDAAARMPNGEGTRAEICILLKDSQFLSPTCTDQQIHQVVSGALDRLHYEKDPCVRYDSSRKVWLYLHYGRTEEEFERLHMAEAALAKSRKRGSGGRQAQRQPRATKRQAAAATAQIPQSHPFTADSGPPSISVSESGTSVVEPEPEIESEFLINEDSNSQPTNLSIPQPVNPIDEPASTPEVDTSFGSHLVDESAPSSSSSGSGSSSEGSSGSDSEDNGGSDSSSSPSSSGRPHTAVIPGTIQVAADSASEGSSSSM